MSIPALVRRTPIIYRFPFKVKIPKSVLNEEDLEKKLNHVNKFLRQRVSFSFCEYGSEQICKSCRLPKDMCIYEPILNVDSLRRLNRACNWFYRHSDKRSRTTHTDKKAFMFDNMSLADVLVVLQEMSRVHRECKPLYDSLLAFVTAVCHGLKVKRQQMQRYLNRSKFVLIRYSPQCGLHMHVDKIWRAKGPVFTMHVGMAIGIYVMTCLNSSDSIAIEVREGEMTSMDGQSRFEWAHGVPYNCGHDTRFSFVLLSDSMPGCKSIWSEVLKEKLPLSTCEMCQS